MQITQHVEQWWAAHREEVIGWRRHLHAHPELSHAEFATTEFIAETLRSYGLQPRLLHGTGLFVDIGPATEERVGFRADIDALPVQEVTGLSYSSTVPGVSHACGHDVHITVSLALACALATAPLQVGVRVIFQPAEEVLSGGAPEVIAQGALRGVGVLYAVHVEPKLRVGRIGVRTGAITSATDVVRLTVRGDGGHSSRPHLTQDVVYALGALITQLPGLLSRRVDPRSGTVVVFGKVAAGGAPNAIPQVGEIYGTVRTAEMKVWREIETLFTQVAEQIIAPTGCRVEVDYTRGVPPVLNDEVATAVLAEAGNTLGQQVVVEAPQSSGGEDFSWYLEHVPGSMARLGGWSGEGKAQDLHMGDLVVDERAIDTGVRLFAGVVERFNQRVAGAD